MIDIQQRISIHEKLEVLDPNSKPLFGKMSPQHMVEHLNITVMFSNGMFPQKLAVPAEKAELFKQVVVHSDKEISQGFKTPLLGDEPPAFQFAGLEEAIEKLKESVSAFDRYFEQHPNDEPINPILGPLNHEEWIVFHNKHFTHHFKQFGL